MKIVKAAAFLLFLCTMVLLMLPLLVLPSQRRFQVGALGVHHACRFLLKILRIRYSELSPDEAGPVRPKVIVANHVSYLDIAVLFARTPCVFLGKKEIARWPLIASVAKSTGMVFVDRNSLWSRARVILELQTRMQQGFSVVIFPEGTTTLEGPRRGLSSYFNGAFRLSRMEEAPIELLYLQYQESERCAWLGDDSFVGHLWNFFGAKSTHVQIRSLRVPAVCGRRGQRWVSSWAREWFLQSGRPLALSPLQENLHRPYEVIALCS